MSYYLLKSLAKFVENSDVELDAIILYQKSMINIFLRICI